MDLIMQEAIEKYICKATNKIAEISTIATDRLEETGCRCDITEEITAILDINSSLFILNKSWERIEPTYGYPNYLIPLYGEH